METIRVERDGPVGRVVLDRPKVRNAFDDVMLRELRAAFAELGGAAEVRAVVLAGTGTVFCAGADLGWMRRAIASSFEDNLAGSLEVAGLMRDLYELPKPLVARVQGSAIGGGVGLVACADIAVAAESARFSFSEVRIGMVPACISPYVLKRVGERWAREYFITGKRLTAAEALACGLVNRVVPDAELDATVQSYLEGLLAGGPQAIALCKRMVRAVSEMSLDEAGPHTAELIARMRTGAEAQEGMRAFLEKRPPAWRAARGFAPPTHPTPEGDA